MENSNNINNALTRFSSAVLSLEVAVERRLKAEQSIATLQDEVQQLSDDRAHMAESLDSYVTKTENLEIVNREVSHRLVNTMESIRSVLEEQGVK